MKENNFMGKDTFMKENNFMEKDNFMEKNTFMKMENYIAEDHYVVVGRDYDKGKPKNERLVGSFESEDQAIFYAKSCNYVIDCLVDKYWDFEKVPLDTQLIDESLRNYSSWPSYFIKKVIIKEHPYDPGSDSQIDAMSSY